MAMASRAMATIVVIRVSHNSPLFSPLFTLHSSLPMWPFSKKRYSLADSGLFEGMTDYHCHILPGVDDGVQTLKESISALQQLSKLGVKEMWLTPHIMEEYPNTPDDLQKRFERLCAEPQVQDCGISLHLAAEHMLDSLFIGRFASGNVLPIINGKYLLVETSYYNPPIQLYEILDNIIKQGYTPLLAHPERYVYMNARDYSRLKDMGIVMQLNLLSLFGAYGEDAFSKAHKLLDKDYYSVFGTDIHSIDSFLYHVSEPSLVSGDIKKLRRMTLG